MMNRVNKINIMKKSILSKSNILNFLSRIAISIAFILAFSHAVMAAVTCQNSASAPALVMNVSVNVSDAYAGADIPVGSLLYRMHIAKTDQVGIYCDGNFTLQNYLSTGVSSYGSPTLMSTPYGTGYAFPTNVPGVGVVLWTAPSGTTDNIILSTNQSEYSVYSTDTVLRRATLNVSLIKTGPIASGSVVNASSFPTIYWRIPAQGSYIGLPIRLASMTFNGTLSFVTKTCTTPSFTVKMGTFDIQKTFKKVGNTTPWINSSIVLQNCPKFSGYYGSKATPQTVLNSSGTEIIVDAGKASGGARQPNLFTISLAPTTSVSNDLISLISGSDAATGVSLQLGYTPDDLGANALNPKNIWKKGESWALNPLSTGVTTMKIPLAARYYQSSDRVTAGKANAKVVFTISYK